MDAGRLCLVFSEGSVGLAVMNFEVSVLKKPVSNLMSLVSNVDMSRLFGKHLQ